MPNGFLKSRFTPVHAAESNWQYQLQRHSYCSMRQGVLQDTVIISSLITCTTHRSPTTKSARWWSKIVFFWMHRNCMLCLLTILFLHSLDMLSTTTCTLKNIQLWNLTWHAKYPCCHPDVPPCGCMVQIYIKLHEIFEAFALRGQSLAVKTRQRYETWRGESMQVILCVYMLFCFILDAKMCILHN